MEEIFVFTASNNEAQKHLGETIEKPIRKDRLSKYLDEDMLPQFADPSDPTSFYCWGATPGPRNKNNWNEMKSGDRILIYFDKALHYYSSVTHKIHDPELARELWGKDNKDDTWEYIYFLTKPQKLDPPLVTAEVSTYMHKQFQGFTHLSDERRDKLFKDYGSLEKFFAQNKAATNGEKTMPKTKYQELLLTIKTKPFIILAGLSGTGKSHLVRTIAYKTCPKGKLRKNESKPGNFELIKVRPNWHDSTEVVGYESRINGDRYIVTDFVRFIVKAWKHLEVPFFLCLDEMNLAPVEQYFAEYLSVFETRKKVKNGKIKTDAIISADTFKKYATQLESDLGISSDLPKQFQLHGITLPENLVVMGTVNMDETTHSFSHKVLDRAMTIEKNNFDLKSGLQNHHSDWKYEDQPLSYQQTIGNKISGSDVYKQFSESEQVITFLDEVNEKLAGTSFLATYRVRDEFLIYCYHFSQLKEKPEDWFIHALDNMMHMKILPKIEGETDQTEPTLKGLKSIAEQKGLEESLKKIEQMMSKLERFRYTSYWY